MPEISTFLRYPGSKRRMLAFLLANLPDSDSIKGRFVEPFLGGGAVYFAISPKRAYLGDINRELIDLYQGIVLSPDRVWRLYKGFPSTKTGYKRIRAARPESLTILQRSARSLFLNRTCFKGMWRHNLAGQFNIGYGGQDRRWSISRADLFHVAGQLEHAQIRCCDFETMIDASRPRDYVFLDPPYRPGAKEQIHAHYDSHQFKFCDHQRLSKALQRADTRRVPWAITISDHPEILALYKHFRKLAIPRGTGNSIGSFSHFGGEVLITNC